EDLEFRISDEDDDGDDSPGPKSPSTTSYLHCRWADIEELEKDKRIHQKVKRFKAKQALGNFLSEMDDEPFNPDYVEVDRVLDVSESTDENGEPVALYLVKWCSLAYEDSTWELKADIDQGKIEEFERVMEREPQLKRVERPPASDWQKSESSREYKNGNALREYQLEGVNWLLFNWYNTRNCILADEMGLGKTIQSITFLHEIYLKGIYGPFLVIAPLSTIPNWEREFRTWTELNVVVYHGSQASRKTIQAYEMYYRDTQGRVIKGSYKFHAIITTFEMILTDCPELRSVPWRCVIIDEAHRLKNRNCKLLEGLKMMDMHKVLLTGTPLQNTVEELFSLLHFLEPDRFPSEPTFMQEFGDLKTEEQVQKLQGILKPMMLRRLKEDVEKNLAPKEETIIEVELTNVQKKYYRAILEKNFAFLSKSVGGGGGGGGSNVPNLLNTMMELRKCCNHPYLINGAEEKIMEEFRESHPLDHPEFHLQAMIQAAGKLVLINKLLPKLKAGGHRVLIFSQMVRCLDILEDYLIQRRYPYERIDGRVRGNLRQAAIDRFSRPDSDRFVFLLCTRAGGLGINLTAADTCIIFDSDWNPQNDLQAQARCHRIGQSKAVKIYRLITRNSYEREMFDKASLKLGLDKAVLQSMSGRENAANGVQQLSKKEIEDLLRKGAYGALMDEEDEGSKFCEEDIDQILQRRTQTITIESEGKGSTFAKASFVASGNRSDISLEDPDFWQKWAKKAELDLDMINGRNNLVIDTPRVRKQTRHYSSMKEDDLMEYSELESDSEDKPIQKPRRPQDRTQGYPRSECFRVEKNLLVYGWGRWGDILSHGCFKRPLRERDVETICRALLAYCLLHYRGDENIKSFIWDLITPTEDGQSRTLTNHSGLSAPVPRGRKGKKGKPQAVQTHMPQADWLADCNPELLLQEDSYKRHLKHHCNKVLLRVRMLYYLRQEVIGDHADRILEGTDSSELDIWIPQPFHADVPTDWWDLDADKSLLIGVFKHGYEKYNSMCADPTLCFLERVGMPDAKAIGLLLFFLSLALSFFLYPSPRFSFGSFLCFLSHTKSLSLFHNREDEDPEYKPLRMPFKDDLDVTGNLYWPPASALTARLRRLITAYQRTHKREQLRQGSHHLISIYRHLFSRWTRWTRREEADFYRVVSTFGVVYDVHRRCFDWSQFRAFARLDKKTDESLEKYYYSFVAMCKRVCRMQVKAETDPTLIIDPITEERASRTLYRIELLRRIREQVLPHPLLDERLSLCQPSTDLPAWWEPGRHDRDLLRGAAKHGVSRTDYHILNDPELSFLEAHRKFTQSKGAELSIVSGPLTPLNLLKDEEVKEEQGGDVLVPKDRVMINRMDNICEAVMKGKWPSNRRHFFDLPGLLPGYSSMATDSPLQRRSLGDLSMVGQTSYSGSEDLTMSPQVNKAIPRQRRRRRRKVEIEAERAAKRRNLMEMVAHLRESHAAEGQAQAIDLTKALHGVSSSSSAFPGAMASSAALKAQMELLQAGASSRPRANGSLLDTELPNRRKRGRRKNVEGLELLFMGNKRGQLNTVRILSGCDENSDGTKAFVDGRAHRPMSSPAHKAPVEGLEEGSHLTGEDGPSTKDLREWLRQHPTYTMNMPGYVPVSKNEDLLSPFAKPKQKRHRCRNPNKIDINTLTGEERVPVVNIRNGRKMGGAMAPPMKDLPRWLVENSEFAIAPDWTDIVKQSGFLPESMFDRLLSGPVVREEGVRRRGRRPKSEIAKVTAAAQAAASAVASTSGVNPLLMNGLFGSMDLTSLQGLQNLQSLQLAAGLMGFPASLGGGADTKHAATMLPLMLPGMGGLPNMFSLGSLFGGSLAAAATATDGASGTEHADSEENPKLKTDEETKDEGDEKEKEAEKSNEMESAEATSDAAALNAAVAAAATGMSTNVLAFNPFLLSTMAPGLFYPSMFLPPSLGGLGIPGFPQASLADLQSAVSGAFGATGEDKDSGKGPRTNQDQNASTADMETANNTLEDSDSEESQNKTADSSVLDDDLAGPAEEMDSMEGGMDDEEEDDDEEEEEEDDPADEDDKSD
uniref:Chromodomain helicase DNA binding protein 7 n=1 Tax=Sinocyclocheilus grahami TaxID=75366 RepID=A0A672SNU6_SINGR